MNGEDDHWVGSLTKCIQNIHRICSTNLTFTSIAKIQIGNLQINKEIQMSNKHRKIWSVLLSVHRNAN